MTRILTNVDAIAAQRQIAAVSLRYSRSVERLSSGQRIVKAADDAAGLAIAEKINNEVRGLNQALRNSQDAISLLQTAEGGMGEVHSILGRVRELAVQSASDTNTATDRATLQNEVTALLAEVDRIAGVTAFNGRKLLDGSAGVVVASSHADVSDVTATADTTSGSVTVNVTGATKTTRNSNAVPNTWADSTAAFTSASAITLNGYTFSFAIGTTVQDAVDAINDLKSVTKIEVTFDPDTDAGGADTGFFKFDSTEFGAGSTFNVTNVSGHFAGADGAATAGVNANVTAGLSAGTFTANGQTIEVTTGTYKGLKFKVNADENGVLLNIGVNNAMKLQVGAFKDQTISVGINRVSTSGLGIDTIDISTQAGANSALNLIDTAVDTVSTQRSKVGAAQNRLDHTVANLSVARENLSAAHSRIRDLDVASETVEFTKSQILMTAGIAVLAQANQQPNALLALLR